MPGSSSTTTLPHFRPEPRLVGIQALHHGEGLGTHGARHSKHVIALGCGHVRHAGELFDDVIGPANGLRSFVDVFLPALHTRALFLCRWCFICRKEMQACLSLLELLVHVRW